jgi:hypothetical protein
MKLNKCLNFNVLKWFIPKTDVQPFAFTNSKAFKKDYLWMSLVCMAEVIRTMLE